MKKWSLILALILCLIAVGGLAVVFSADKPDDTTGGQNSSIDTPIDDSNSSGVSNAHDTSIEVITLKETNLIF